MSKSDIVKRYCEGRGLPYVEVMLDGRCIRHEPTPLWCWAEPEPTPVKIGDDIIPWQELIEHLRHRIISYRPTR